MVEAIFSLVGVVVGSGLVLLYNYYRDRREREDKYRVMTYQKRLEVHQKAFYLIRELNESFPGSIEYMDEDTITAIEKVRAEVEEWWALHCFYLDPKSSDKIMDIVVRSEELVRDYGLPNDSPDTLDKDIGKSWLRERAEFTRCIVDTKRALEKGIRMKHIEEPEKEQSEGKS